MMSEAIIDISLDEKTDSIKEGSIAEQTRDVQKSLDTFLTAILSNTSDVRIPIPNDATVISEKSVEVLMEFKKEMQQFLSQPDDLKSFVMREQIFFSGLSIFELLTSNRHEIIQEFLTQIRSYHKKIKGDVE